MQFKPVQVDVCSIANYKSLYMKRLNKTESPIFVLLCSLCFQRQLFRFVSFKDQDKYGKVNLKGKYGYIVSPCLAIRRTQPWLNEPQREKTYLQTCAPNEDSNQTAHPRSLIRVFVIRMKKLCILGYPKMRPVKILTKMPNEQADLNYRLAYESEIFFKCVLEAYEEGRLGYSQFAHRSAGYSRLYNL